ncbi:hypothetical protein GCM10010869_28740 [Mesorhizobium tianshanense]|nr:hypothetical protein GCM10010869_28740 [Mesorhizobium tianshanense]
MRTVCALQGMEMLAAWRKRLSHMSRRCWLQAYDLIDWQALSWATSRCVNYQMP